MFCIEIRQQDRGYETGTSERASAVTHGHQRHAAKGGGQCWCVVSLVIQSGPLGLVLCRGQVAERFVESLSVVEADPVQGLMLGVLEAREAAPQDGYERAWEFWKQRLPVNGTRH